MYFVVAGRNAWWSTWIRRYADGSLHHTLQSAKTYCEGRRVQGTRFYIEELPTLAVRDGERWLLITQINTEEPLKGLKHDTLRKLDELVGLETFSLSQLARVFSRSSQIWSPALPAENSLLIVCADSSTEFAPTSNNHVPQLWTSTSLGPQYLLQWHGQDSDCAVNYVEAAVRLLSSSQGDR